jgi:hypothetical protein
MKRVTPPVTKAEEMPKKVLPPTPPTVEGTPEANQTALLGKVADYLGLDVIVQPSWYY